MEKIKADVVIAAKNEESRIRVVIKAAQQAKYTNRIIVVANGCQDKTAEAASVMGAETYILEQANKGLAILHGIKQVQTKIVCTLDADLLNITSNQIDNLIQPLLSNTHVLSLAGFPSRRARLIVKYPWLWEFSLTGQRAFAVELARELKIKRVNGYRFEAAMNLLAFKKRLPIYYMELTDLICTRREEKEFSTNRLNKWLSITHCYGQYCYGLPAVIGRILVKQR